MEPYIHGKRNMIHIIDVKETVKGLLRAKRLIAQTIAGGKDVLFVGTKLQARFAIEEETKRCGMHYVSERWLGGTLTNFRTIRDRLKRLEELEKLWETGQIETYSKKMKSTLNREKDKIKTNLEGIRKMDRMPRPAGRPEPPPAPKSPGPPPPNPSRPTSAPPSRPRLPNRSPPATAPDSSPQTRSPNRGAIQKRSPLSSLATDNGPRTTDN